MAKHKAGPWKVIEHSDRTGMHKVELASGIYEEADAKLMAASPDLHKTLCRVEEYVERAAERGEDDARESLAVLRDLLDNLGRE